MRGGCRDRGRSGRRMMVVGVVAGVVNVVLARDLNVLLLLLLLLDLHELLLLLVVLVV